MSSRSRPQRDRHDERRGGEFVTRQDGLAVGAVLAGRYRLERVLSRGGMGIVVKAMHLQLQQPVAMKFLRPELHDDPQVLQRFLREAQAAVRLKSEHVARVLDVGSHETGGPYMVLEYLEGATQQVVSPTTAQFGPARSTCSCGPARRGPSRRISRPPIRGRSTNSAIRWRCPGTRWRSVRISNPAGPPESTQRAVRPTTAQALPARSTCSAEGPRCAHLIPNDPGESPSEADVAATLGQCLLSSLPRLRSPHLRCRELACSARGRLAAYFHLLGERHDLRVRELERGAHLLRGLRIATDRIARIGDSEESSAVQTSTPTAHGARRTGRGYPPSFPRNRSVRPRRVGEAGGNSMRFMPPRLRFRNT